jgi:hypothetical protein
MIHASFNYNRIPAIYNASFMHHLTTIEFVAIYNASFNYNLGRQVRGGSNNQRWKESHEAIACVSKDPERFYGAAGVAMVAS